MDSVLVEKQTASLYSEANKGRFSDVTEREFQEVFYNPRAHAFITRWGLLPGVAILMAFWIADHFGFTQQLHTIAIIRVVSIVPLLLIYALRQRSFVYRNIRDIYSWYLFLLANTVSAIIAITPHEDYGHRGYMLSFPMVIFTVFLAKPKLHTALTVSVGFTAIFVATSVIFDVRPLGLGDVVSQIHVALVMLSSIVIGACTCYVLESAERREFIQRKVIEQDKELILLQQFELNESLQQLSKANEQLELQNVRLDYLNREKNEFLGIAAHDLKNPLSGISMSVANVRRYLKRMSGEDVIKVMDNVDKAATRMRDIIVNLLDVNQIENGRTTIDIRSVDLNQILNSVVADYSERAAKKSIRLRTEIHPQPCLCKADENILMQIVDNLVSNALKFSPEGKDVWIRTSTRLEQEEACARFSVRDEGPGLSEEDHKKLFGRFQKLSATPTAGEHSSGLGLSIVKKMADMFGAKVWCESKLGEGATFIVEFKPIHQSSLNAVIQPETEMRSVERIEQLS